MTIYHWWQCYCSIAPCGVIIPAWVSGVARLARMGHCESQVSEDEWMIQFPTSSFFIIITPLREADGTKSLTLYFK